MSQRKIRAGMVVRCHDGAPLGRVLAVDDEGFVLERRVVVTREHRVHHDEVRSLDEHGIVLIPEHGHPRAPGGHGPGGGLLVLAARTGRAAAPGGTGSTGDALLAPHGGRDGARRGPPHPGGARHRSPSPLRAHVRGGAPQERPCTARRRPRPRFAGRSTTLALDARALGPRGEAAQWTDGAALRDAPARGGELAAGAATRRDILPPLLSGRRHRIPGSCGVGILVPAC